MPPDCSEGVIALSGYNYISYRCNALARAGQTPLSLFSLLLLKTKMSSSVRVAVRVCPCFRIALSVFGSTQSPNPSRLEILQGWKPEPHHPVEQRRAFPVFRLVSGWSMVVIAAGRSQTPDPGSSGVRRQSGSPIVWG